MKRIAIISPSDLPIPAVKGGAVETGIEQIIKQNEYNKKVMIDIYSYYDRDAENKSYEYKNTKFYYYTPKKIDYIFVFLAKLSNKVFKKINIKIKISVRLNYIRFLKRNIKKTKYDAILIKNNVDIVIPLASITDSKIFLQLHNDNLNINTPYAKRIYSKCHKIIVNSSYIKRCVLSIPSINDNDVLINKNCLDNESFKVATKREKINIASKYKINDRKINVLFSGRLVPQKGIKELMEAINLIKDKIDLNLLIAGSKWFGKTSKDRFFIELEKLKKLIGDRVIFLGYVPHNDIRIINSIADLVVIPSIWEEPAGRVALEAQAVGTPLIITNSGGMPEYVNNKKSAIIIDKNDKIVDNLANTILKLLKDKELRINMSIEGKKYAASYTEEKYYFEILDELEIFED